jgi:hypothetical protein
VNKETKTTIVNMRAEDLYNQRLTRILKAVALEKPDRTPVVLEYSGFAAYVTRTSMAEFLRSPKTNVDTMIQTFRLVGDGDAVNYGAFWPYGLYVQGSRAGGGFAG